jgi:hypothetical protein
MFHAQENACMDGSTVEIMKKTQLVRSDRCGAWRRLSSQTGDADQMLANSLRFIG